MSADFYIRQDMGQLILHLFIQQHLFPHVKTGQSIIYHQHHIDIGYRNAALPAKLMGQFGGTAMPVSIRPIPTDSKFFATIL